MVVFSIHILSAALRSQDATPITINLNVDFGLACSFRVISSDGKSVIEGTRDETNGKKIHFEAIPPGKYRFAVLPLMLIEPQIYFSTEVEVKENDPATQKNLTVTNIYKKKFSISIDAKLFPRFFLNKGYVRIERLREDGAPDDFRACASLWANKSGFESNLFGLEKGIFRLTLVSPMNPSMKPFDILSTVVEFEQDDFDAKPLLLEVKKK